MSTQSEPLRLMLGAVIAMREAGYTQEDVQELAGEAWGYEGGGQPTSGPSWSVSLVPDVASLGRAGNPRPSESVVGGISGRFERLFAAR